MSGSHRSRKGLHHREPSPDLAALGRGFVRRTCPCSRVSGHCCGPTPCSLCLVPLRGRIRRRRRRFRRLPRFTFGSGIVADDPDQTAATADGGSAVIAPAVAVPESNADGSDGRSPLVQQCSICGHTERASRHKKRLKCRECEHQDHADRSAGISVTQRWLKRQENRGMPALNSSHRCGSGRYNGRHRGLWTVRPWPTTPLKPTRPMVCRMCPTNPREEAPGSYGRHRLP